MHSIEGLEYVRDETGLMVPTVPSGQTALWAPQPGSQQLFLQCTAEEVLYEGTRGPGKTDAALMDFCQDVGVGWGGDWAGVLFRRTYPELQDVIQKSLRWFKQYMPTAKYNESMSQWVFPEGERLLFRQFAKPSDYWKFHGHAYPWICWEELCTYPNDECFKSMFSCSRSTRQGMPRKVRATANPYGPGHNWVKMRYNLPVPPGRIIGDLVEEEGMPARIAIHGHLDENVVLLAADPKYKDRIRAAARNPAELAAWLDGSWDIVAGGMIDDVWFRVKDVAVVKPFPIPQGWMINRSMDWGSSRPSSIGYWAQSNGEDYVDGNGKRRGSVRGDLFRIGEVYTWTGKPNEGTRLLNTEISKQAVEYEIKMGWRTEQGSRVRPGPGDSQMFTASGTETSIHDDLMKPVIVNGVKYKGISFIETEKGPGSRKQGWQQLREWLGNTMPEPGKKAREKPGMFIFSNCRQFLRTVPVLPRDEKDMDDVDTESEDHVGDDVRYRLRQMRRIGPQRTSVGTGG
jgi:hypothetical protein